MHPQVFQHFSPTTTDQFASPQPCVALIPDPATMICHRGHGAVVQSSASKRSSSGHQRKVAGHPMDTPFAPKETRPTAPAAVVQNRRGGQGYSGRESLAERSRRGMSGNWHLRWLHTVDLTPFDWLASCHDVLTGQPTWARVEPELRCTNQKGRERPFNVQK
eukprot:s401_g8.t1